MPQRSVEGKYSKTSQKAKAAIGFMSTPSKPTFGAIPILESPLDLPGVITKAWVGRLFPKCTTSNGPWRPRLENNNLLLVRLILSKTPYLEKELGHALRAQWRTCTKHFIAPYEFATFSISVSHAAGALTLTVIEDILYVYITAIVLYKLSWLKTNLCPRRRIGTTSQLLRSEQELSVYYQIC